MKKVTRKDHPEIKEIKNICDVSPHAKTTHDVCDKFDNERKSKNHKKSR
jgi:hypothetical protein